LNIDWNRIIDYQTTCLKNGLNKVGIPDLIIVDNAVEHNLVLFTLDKHLKLKKEHIDLKLVEL
jgi:hypothetical protein